MYIKSPKGMMTMSKYPEIYKSLEEKGSFSVASLQKDFDLSYMEAREFVKKLEKQEKASISEDGVTYKYQTPLKTITEAKTSAFERWLSGRRFSPEELQQQEVNILKELSISFGGKITSNGENAYILDLSKPTKSVPKIYIELYNNKFRVHDNNYINDNYKDSLGLDTKEGALLMNRILKRRFHVLTLDDGKLGYNSVTSSNVTIAIEELLEVMALLDENDTNGMVVSDYLTNAFLAVDDALSVLIAQNPDADRQKLLKQITREIDSDYLTNEEEAGYEIIKTYLSEFTDDGFSRAAGLITKNSRPKYVYKKK